MGIPNLNHSYAVVTFHGGQLRVLARLDKPTPDQWLGSGDVLRLWVNDERCACHAADVFFVSEKTEAEYKETMAEVRRTQAEKTLASSGFRLNQ